MTKSEIRNLKEARNPKPETWRAVLRLIRTSDFGFLLAALSHRRSGSDFGRRISDLLLANTKRGVA